ncbi:hypothetical protein F5Y14DRAFT_462270 [Nemania sp. NC0429]|nr:hypothetical protein F5Y14DRAFT_462270 [Nemania sp. NC0429]
MANGFEKIERWFTGSRKRGRGKRKATQQQRTSIITSRRPSSPIFPAPSYLRPTSTHMKPRDAQIDPPDKDDKGRSQSVPSLQEALHDRFSAASSITIVDQPNRSDAPSSSLRRRKNSTNASRPPRFRFPEDSLIRNNRSARKSRDFSKNAVREQLLSTSATETKGLLDWTPKHISLLFNPLEFKSSSSEPLLSPGNPGPEATLLPSPDFTLSTVPPESHEPVHHHHQNRSITTNLSLFPRDSVQKLTSNLSQKPLVSSEKLLTVPSVSNNEDNDRKPAIHRSVSLDCLNPSCPSTPHTTPMSPALPSANSNFASRRGARETWGNRLEDPQFSGSTITNNEETPKPKLRKSASTSTLSVFTSPVSKDLTILKEPTFDDFYSLSDDDIAESRPSTPTHDIRLPPTPPSQNDPDLYHKSCLPRPLTSEHATIKPTQELTPPDTPTDCHLTLTYSPTSLQDTFGALWAAELARKYDFSILYVLSLWPENGDQSADTSPLTPVSEFGHTNATAAGSAAAPIKGSKINGCLLAAYGLNEVPSPFEIATDTHLSALDCDHWNEYRNVDARPDDISRGWIRTFYSDYTPVSSASPDTFGNTGNHPKNRGIVFAAYSKQTSNSVIPMRASPEQDLLLGRLYADAKTLVEVLVKQPYGPKKTPTC